MWLNYFYRLFFNAAIANGALSLIGVFDKIGFEIHFVRFAYWALVDSVESKSFSNELGNDLYLIPLIILMQLMSMRFLAHPTTEPTDSRIQAFMAPFGLIVCFYFQSYDVLWMGVHCIFVLLYCGYYAMDSDNMINDYS